MRKHKNKLEYEIPSYFSDYASWNYVNNLPRYDENIFQLLLGLKGAEFCREGKLSKNSQVRHMYTYVKYHTPAYFELPTQVDEFKSNNNWIEDYYNFCLNRVTYIYDPFCQSHNNYWINLREDSNPIAVRINEFLRETIDFQRFHMICVSEDLITTYNELKRDVPFVVGNIVRLRSRFIGSRNHDPFYRESKDINSQERIGHITGILNDTHSNSYNGKGSRLVKVYWAATGKEHAQSVASLKLFDQKNNKMVDKLVDE